MTQITKQRDDNLDTHLKSHWKTRTQRSEQATLKWSNFVMECGDEDYDTGLPEVWVFHEPSLSDRLSIGPKGLLDNNLA